MKNFIKKAGKGRHMVTCNFWGDKPNRFTKKENNKAIRQFVKKLTNF